MQKRGLKLMLSGKKSRSYKLMSPLKNVKINQTISDKDKLNLQ